MVAATDSAPVRTMALVKNDGPLIAGPCSVFGPKRLSNGHALRGLRCWSLATLSGRSVLLGSPYCCPNS